MLELIENLNSFQHRSPRMYLILVIASAILGLICLASIPMLGLVFFISSITTVFTLDSAGDLVSLLYLLPLSALCGYLSFQFITLNLDTPKASEIYISINKKKTPKLTALIHELEQHFNLYAIDTILLTDKYDISIHISPQYCLPHLGNTTLQIGLPLMQTVSADQFKALLIRQLGQLSLKNKPQLEQISLFKDIVNQYLIACRQSDNLFHKPFYYFFLYYQRFFNAISFYAIRMNELRADQYAIKSVSETFLSQTISQTILANHYLKNMFWVSMYKLQRQYSNKAIYPHANMAVSFAQSNNIDKSREIINHQFQQLHDFESPAPLLRTRLRELGLESYSLPEEIESTAAIIYLSTALPKITKIFDKLWLQNIQEQQHSSILLDGNEQRLNLLTTKLTEQPLSAVETWELAVLTEKIKGYSFAIPIYKKILERNPQHAKSMFAIGRILLSYNDATGLNVLSKAVLIEPTMQKTADELIARYQSRIHEAELDSLPEEELLV